LLPFSPNSVLTKSGSAVIKTTLRKMDTIDCIVENPKIFISPRKSCWEHIPKLTTKAIQLARKGCMCQQCRLRHGGREACVDFPHRGESQFWLPPPFGLSRRFSNVLPKLKLDRRPDSYHAGLPTINCYRQSKQNTVNCEISFSLKLNDLILTYIFLVH
jgi:hypothetical protein